VSEIERLRVEYANRARRFADSDIYSWFNSASLFTFQSRQRALLDTLKQFGFFDISGLSIMEMGCGTGRIMTELLAIGAKPKSLYGIDLLYNRLIQANCHLPRSNFANADGSAFPFPTGIFDLVLQYTAISSILDPELRRDICTDMLRVLRGPDSASGKPGGLILSYDFWLNPTNPQTRGLRPTEIRRLFPGCEISFQRITLAPPIARRLVPISWGLGYFLESLKIFNSHYLAAIRRKTPQ